MGLQLKIGADFGDAIKEAKVLEGTITSLETKLTALSKTVTISLNPELDPNRLKQQIALLKDTVSEISSKINLDSSEFDNEFKSIQKKIATLDDLSLNITANDTQIVSVINEINSDLANLKANANVKISAQTNFGSVVNDIRTEIASLTANATVGIDAKDFESRIKAISEKVASLTDAKVQITADPTKAEAAINEIVSELQALRNATVIIKADSTQANNVIATIENKLSSLNISIDPSEFRKQITVVQSELNSLTAQVEVTGDTSQVSSVLKELQGKLSQLTDESFDITANPKQAEDAIRDILREVTRLKDEEIFIHADNSQALQAVNTLEKSVQDIHSNITVDSSNIQSKAKEIREAFSSLNFTANVDVDQSKVQGVVKQINENLSLLSDPTIDFTANKVQAEKAISELKDLIATLKGTNVTLTVSGQDAVDGFLNGIYQDLIKVRDVANIPLTVSEEDVKAKINDLKLQLSTISGSTVIGADTTEFDARLKELKAKVAALDVPDIELDANKDLVEATIRDIQEELTRIKGSTVVLDANSKPAIKSINQLEKELFELEKQFKESTNPQDILRLGKAANLVREQIRNVSTGGLQSFNKLSSSSNTATQSLINLGRVAQDAPFGFLGIANNLNPLLEGFQRLQKETGSTGSALSALGKSLSGAGGIGLGLSVVSSLLIVFGKDLFSAGEATAKFDADMGQLSASLKAAKDDIKDFNTELQFLQDLTKIRLEIITPNQDKVAIQGLQQEFITTQEKAVKLTESIADAIKRNDQATKSFFSKASGSALDASAAFGRLIDIPEEVSSSFSEQDQKLLSLAKKTGDALLELQNDQTQNVNTQSILRFKIRLQETVNARKELDKQKDDFEKFVNDIISKARQFQKDFGKTFVTPDLDESFFVNKDEIFKRAKQLLSKVSGGGLQIKLPVQIITETDFIFNPDDLKPPTAKELEDLTKRFFDDAKKEHQEPFVFDVSLQKIILNIKDEKDAKKKVEDRAKELADSIRGVFAQAFQSLGEDIGNAFTGGGNLFQGVFEIIGSGVEALGKQIIALGVAALTLKKALSSLLANPALAIAAGVALTAIGTAMKNIGGGGIKGFAEGGLVFGPTLGLVGEGFGTNRSNPEVIAPLDQLKGMLGGVSDGGSRLGRLRVRGRDLVLVDNRERRSQRA